MSFSKNIFISYITILFTLVFSFIFGIVTAKFLGPAGKGVISLSWQYFFIVLLISTAGMDVANVYYSARLKGQIKYILSNSIYISIINGIIFSFVFIIFYMLFKNSIFNSISIKIILLLSILFPINIFYNLSNSILRGMNKIIEVNFLIFINNLLKVLFLIFLFFGGFTVIRIIYVLVLSQIVSFVLSIGVLKKYLKIKLFKFNFINFKKLIIYGIKSFIGNLVQLLNYRLDIFIINYFLHISQVGVYFIAVSIGELLWKASNAVSFVLFTKISSNKDYDVKFTLRINRIILFISIISSFFLIILTKGILLYLGSSYSGIMNAFLILLPGCILFNIVDILSCNIAGRGMPGKNSIVAIISLVFTLLLDILLIPRYGINGAALASTISYSASALIFIYLFVNIEKVSISDLLIIKKDDYFFLMGKIKSLLMSCNIIK